MSNPEEQSTPPTTWSTWRDRAAAWYTAAVLWLSVALAPAIEWTKERWASQAKPFLREHSVAVVVFLTGMLALIAMVLFICWVVLPIKEASAANARADAAERIAADLRKQLSALTPMEGPTEALQPVAKPRPKPARPAATDEYGGLYGGQSPSKIINEALGHEPSPSGAWTTPTDLDRRLAEFQKRIDATPSPTL
ncbi:MAG: hypothetical protein ACK40L_08835 [Hydrogenophaga sp.]